MRVRRFPASAPALKKRIALFFARIAGVSWGPFVAISSSGTRRRALAQPWSPGPKYPSISGLRGAKQEVMFRLPNLLTLSRILLVPVFVVAFLLHTGYGADVAFAVFCSLA